MTVAAEERIVKRRMDEYLWWERSATNRRLRSLLQKHFLDFDRVAIVGGMVRDFARIGRRGFHSDVDLVIDAPPAEVASLAEMTFAKPNRFGGYSFSADEWKIDFWALGTTWAAQQGHVSVSRLEDITRCTFFDWDAILYDVKQRQVICSEAYLNSIRSGVMEISLRPNPSVSGSLYRAVRRVLLWDLQPGPQLMDYICEHLDDSGFDAVVREDRNRSKAPFLEKFGDAGTLLSFIERKDWRRNLSTFYATQLALPGVLSGRVRAGEQEG